MDLDSPRSPTAQFSVANDPCTSYACPSAPRKPSLRREQETGTFASSIRLARDALESVPEGDRCDALKHLPRQALEGVFLAFCHWQAGTQWGADFQTLLQVAPRLEQDLLDQVQRCYPNITFEEWMSEVDLAVTDTYHGQQLAERIMGGGCAMRRVLF